MQPIYEHASVISPSRIILLVHIHETYNIGLNSIGSGFQQCGILKFVDSDKPVYHSSMVKKL